MITSAIWLPATLLAAIFQPWRTAVQRRVGKQLSINAAGLVRYLYGLPFALMMLAGYHLIFPTAFPALTGKFLLFCAAGGVVQIIATNLLLMAFNARNYVVGTAYSKTEAVQGALLSILLLGEHLNLISWIGIALGVAGIMVLSLGSGKASLGGLLGALRQRGAVYGLASGFFFALTSIGIRAATLEVDTPNIIHAALVTLVATLIIQTILQGALVAVREPDQIPLIAKSWRVSGQVGLLSALGSACWFTGFATAPVALVRIVGQVEVAFTMAFGRFYLREQVTRPEVIGLLLVSGGVVAALVGNL